jgi:hypothetical protein
VNDEQRTEIHAKIESILADPARTRRTVMAAVLAEHALENPVDGENTLYTALSTLRGGMVDTAAVTKALQILFDFSDRMDKRDPA